jgi:hypothetical protein
MTRTDVVAVGEAVGLHHHVVADDALGGESGRSRSTA